MKIVTIVKETVLGKNENHDRLFLEYCEEYSIEYKIIESDVEREYPEVEFKSGPIALSNMLKERFGYSDNEIAEEFPQIGEALDISKE